MEGSIQERLDALRGEIDEKVEKHGWFAMSVFPTQESGDPGLYWTYTIGLSKTHGHPELIIFGLPYKTAHSLLSSAITEIEKGAHIDDGDLVPRVIRDYDVKAVAVPDEKLRDYVGWSLSYDERNEVEPCEPRVLQLVWPDVERRFPWDDGYADEPRDAQPVLGTVRS